MHRAFAWPDAESQPINEFETPSIAVMAFVKLLSLGFADPTKPDRQFDVSETDATAHLLCFAEQDPLNETYITLLRIMIDFNLRGTTG